MPDQDGSDHSQAPIDEEGLGSPPGVVAEAALTARTKRTARIVGEAIRTPDQTPGRDELKAVDLITGSPQLGTLTLISQGPPSWLSRQRWETERALPCARAANNSSRSRRKSTSSAKPRRAPLLRPTAWTDAAAHVPVSLQRWVRRPVQASQGASGKPWSPPLPEPPSAQAPRRA